MSVRNRGTWAKLRLSHAHLAALCGLVIMCSIFGNASTEKVGGGRPRTLSTLPLAAKAATSAQLQAALQDTAVNEVYISSDITLDEAGWTTGVIDLRRNVTVLGCHQTTLAPSETNPWAALDLAYLKDKLRLRPGFSLRFTCILLYRMRRGRFAAMPGGSVCVGEGYCSDLCESAGNKHINGSCRRPRSVHLNIHMPASMWPVLGTLPWLGVSLKGVESLGHALLHCTRSHARTTSVQENSCRAPGIASKHT